jgi:putative membrane protein
MPLNRKTRLLSAAALLLGLLVVSGWQPYDRLTWLLEIFPILIVSYRHFPLTALLYVGIFLHCIVLMAGGAYTYARVPLGFEIADLLFALIGSSLAVLTLPRLQDSQIARLDG